MQHHFPCAVALLIGAASCSSSSSSGGTTRTCDLEQLLVESTGNAPTCGTATDTDSAAVTACAQKALDEKRPFRARYDLHGIDSAFTQALYRDAKGQLGMFTYEDSELSSHGAGAHIERWSCSGIVVSSNPTPGGPDLLTCQGAQRQAVVCDKGQPL
jgi:hypothetical protein